MNTKPVNNQVSRQTYNEACHLARLIARKGMFAEYLEWWNEFPLWLQVHAKDLVEAKSTYRADERSEEGN